jgi:hypothetical protein
MTVGVPGTSRALLLPDPGTNALTYGDFYSYSLPVLAYFYDQANGGGVGPGNPYYIPTGPGHLDDAIVIATGAGGQTPLNYAGMDDAYATPNQSGGITTFYTETGAPAPYNGVADPNPVIANDQEDTWDSTMEAFVEYLGEGNTPLFFFNNNEIDRGDNQDLRIYGTIRLWSSSSDSEVIYELISTTGLGDGGGVLGGDPYSYTYGDVTLDDEYEGSEYVLSGGDMCFPGGVPTPCSQVVGPYDGPVIAHNLGANQAAYLVYSPELNADILAWNPDDPLYDMLSIDLRMYDLSNGYEQAFITSTQNIPTTIPEPSTWLLMALGLLAIPFVRRFRR